MTLSTVYMHTTYCIIVVHKKVEGPKFYVITHSCSIMNSVEDKGVSLFEQDQTWHKVVIEYSNAGID